MAICPEHGHYTGTCKGCKEIGAPIPIKSQEEVPTIPDADKYILRSYELDGVKAQVDAANAQTRAQQAMRNIDLHAKTLFERLNLDPKEWGIDFRTMLFTKRGEDSDENSSGN